MRPLKLFFLLTVTLFLSACVSTRDNSAVDAALTPSGETPERVRARLATQLAAGYLQRQQFNIALEELANATRAEPSYSPAYDIMGLVYHGLNENEKAETAFRRATGLDPNNAEAHNNFAWFLCRTKRERESLEVFEKALRNPLYASPDTALFTAATCAAKGGLIKAAEDYYKRLLQLVPNAAVAYYGLLDIAIKTSRYDEAKSYVRSALNLGEVPARVLEQCVCVSRRVQDKQTELQALNQLSSRFPQSDEYRRVRLATNSNCD